MKLRTEIKPLNHQGVIAHDKPLMMIGSCFSDNIGERLHSDLFDVIINPWGTLYNPASIAGQWRSFAVTRSIMMGTW